MSSAIQFAFCQSCTRIVKTTNLKMDNKSIAASSCLPLTHLLNLGRMSAIATTDTHALLWLIQLVVSPIISLASRNTSLSCRIHME
jgi:hypothetical protein